MRRGGGLARGDGESPAAPPRREIESSEAASRAHMAGRRRYEDAVNVQIVGALVRKNLPALPVHVTRALPIRS